MENRTTKATVNKETKTTQPSPVGVIKKGTDNTPKTPTPTPAPKTTSIIDVVINGMKAVDVIEDVKKRLEGVEKSAFNIALECAYILGVTIPEYTDNMGNKHGKATCDKPIKKQADLLKLIGRSKQTLSRWIKAINLIIDSEYFNDFASGKFPFSYDKIIIILENKEIFKGYVLSDLMSMTVDTLETISEKKSDTTEETSETEASSDDTTEETTEEITEETSETEASSDDTTIIAYNGKEYVVNKSAFEKWLTENATVK